MDRIRKEKSLLNKSLTQFIICVSIVLLKATPLFYLLTKYFYAEDLLSIIKSAQSNQPLPAIDLERDIIMGIVIQFGLITLVLCVSLIFMLRIISKRIWTPFNNTLLQLQEFNLEQGTLPSFDNSDIKEFSLLNAALTSLIKNNLKSYKSQKEFTENASHELQTPLAVIRGKLDLLLQEPDMTKNQAELVQSIYDVSNRLARLNNSLLLLTRIDNHQYTQVELVNVSDLLKNILSRFADLKQNVNIHQNIETNLTVKCNQILLESMLNNLIINALKYNKVNGDIDIILSNRALIVSNTSNQTKLDEKLIFNRFYRPSEKVKGNGLGLAIVKAICDFHGWDINYNYSEMCHNFIIKF